MVSKVQTVLWLVSLLLLAPSAQAQEKSLLWEISGNGLKEKSYLFGTYHLLSDKYVKSSKQVEKAFDKAESVMVEVELDESAQQKAMQYSMMHGKTIPGLIHGKEDLEQLDKELKSNLQVGIQQLQTLKPAAIMLTLALIQAQQNLPEDLQEFQGGTPMDMYFMAEGRKRGKNGLSLETLDDQLKLLYDSYTLEEQADQLMQFVKERKAMIALSRNISNSYLEKDIAAMWKLNQEYSEAYAPDQEDVLIRPRNEKWVPIIEAQIAKETTFIAVGALHLPGEFGLIELLKAKGFTVKAIKN